MITAMDKQTKIMFAALPLLSLKLSAGALMMWPLQSFRVRMEDMLSLVGLQVLEKVVMTFM
jgi:hypothetical protein